VRYIGELVKQQMGAEYWGEMIQGKVDKKYFDYLLAA